MTIPDIAAMQRQHLERKIKVYPQRNLRASNIGHPCEWHVWGSVTHWEQAKAHGPELEAIFEEGRRQEEHVKRDLMEWGLRVEEGQRPLWDEELQLGGHLECVLVDSDGERWLAEIKSMADGIWQRVHDVSDMAESDAAYLRAYPWQMEAYRMMAEQQGIIEKDRPALWILKNKQNGLIKSIPQSPDPVLRGWLVDRCREIDGALKSGAEPEKLSDPTVCEHCKLRAVCGPDMRLPQLTIDESEEMQQALDRRVELKGAADEYGKLDRKIKKRFAGAELVQVGERWRITGKEVRRKAYSVEAGSYWRLAIREIT